MEKNVIKKTQQDDRLNSRIGRTFTYKEFVGLVSKLPIKIKALV